VTPLALSTGTIAALLIMVGAILFATFFGLSFLRQDRATRAAAAAGLPGAPPPPSAKAISRRDFFRRSLISSLLVFAAQFGGGTIAFLWPNLKGGFGSVIPIGKLDDIKAEIQDTGGAVYAGSARTWIVPYHGRATADADYVKDGVAVQGIMALYQRCVHLGCRVPFCNTSKWFECPCHGSKYNEAGEYQLGPAPKGLDRFRMEIASDGTVTVDTSQIVLGPPRGTNTIDQPPQGPFCVATG
jgi:cytochrome b6-f complex iron-sulfur subunit